MEQNVSCNLALILHFFGYVDLQRRAKHLRKSLEHRLRHVPADLRRLQRGQLDAAPELHRQHLLRPASQTHVIECNQKA